MNPILPGIVGFGKIARPRMRIFMALEPQRVINHPLASRSVTMVPDDAPIHTGAKKKTATTRRLKLNSLGVEHELTQIDPIGHRTRFRRTCGTRARANQAHRRHRHAHQILGALDR
jgi:hypothetical protein